MLNVLQKIYIAGHKGMAGSAIERKLKSEGFTNIITCSSKDLDLRNQNQVNEFFINIKPDIVILAAAKVGGIISNSKYRAEFIYDNLMMEANVIHAAYQYQVEKLLFLGSSCIYPKFAPQPLKEEYLLSGYLEQTNQPYAIAKIAGVKTCQAINKQFNKKFLTLMPTNTYGREDNFDLITSHVLPAMIRKFHDAKINNNEDVVLWGSGTPMREFLYVDDLAEAVSFALENKLSEHLYNVGTGKDITIKELAETIQKVIGHKGNIIWDAGKPDGTPKLKPDGTLNIKHDDIGF